MTTTVVPTTICRNCGYCPNEATPADDSNSKPIPGSVAVCFNCGEISVFTDALGLRPALKNDLETLPKNVVDLLQYTRRIIVTRGRLHQPEEEKGHA